MNQIKKIAHTAEEIDTLFNTVDNIVTGLDYYGVEWDITVADPELTRIGSQAMLDQMPVHEGMYACVMDDDGNVVYKLDPDDYNYKEDGTASNLDGTDGQVMVVIPEHYRKFEIDGNKRRVKISHIPIPGYDKVQSWAIGVYEAYLDTADGNKLCSISGVTPTTNKYRSEFRTYANNRGSNWAQLNYDAYNTLTWLAVIETASFYSQDAISTGATNASSTDWSNYNAYNPVVDTGLIDDSGMLTGSVAFAVASFVGGVSDLNSQAACYRGIEHIFGHIWKFIDGLNLHNSSANGALAYITEDPANFADDTDSNYTLLGNIAEADGYVKQMLDNTIIPLVVSGGSSSTYYTDYHYSYYDNDPDSGWRVARWGGALNHGAIAGLFCSYFDYGAASRAALIGARLCCKL